MCVTVAVAAAEGLEPLECLNLRVAYSSTLKTSNENCVINGFISCREVAGFFAIACMLGQQQMLSRNGTNGDVSRRDQTDAL